MTFFIFLFSFAASCPSDIQRVGSYQIHQFSGSQNDCVLRLNQTKTDQSRRNFQFFEKGLFEVYTIMGSKSGDVGSPGARSYFIVPFSGKPSFENSGSSALIHDSSGLTWKMDGKGKLTSENGCKINQSEITSWEQESKANSGFTLQSCPGSLVVDLGFKRGEPPNLLNRNGKASIRDSRGKSCQVKNSDLLNYSQKNRYDYKWKFDSSANFERFLSQHEDCKKLDLSPLRKTGSGSQGRGNL